MKNNANSLVIGMFVLGAVFLAVVSIIIFGTSKFFEEDQMFASLFKETVNGLDVGAPVKFKGVKIGKVERISIGSPRHTHVKEIPNKYKREREDVIVVFYTIDLNLLKRRMHETGSDSGSNWVREQIKEGLRAKLSYQSIVTGMLYIELDYFAQPDNKLEIYETSKFIGIPGESSGLEEFMKSIQDSIAEISQIKFKELFDNVNSLVVNLNKKVEAVDTKGLSDSAMKALADADALMKNADALVLSANTAAGDASAFLKITDANIAALSKDVRSTLSKVDALVENVGAMTAPNSPLRFELAMLIRSMNSSMNSIANLADYLQRNPSALLTGKPQLNLKKD